MSSQKNRWLRARDSIKAAFAAARGTELEQAWLRVLIGGVVMAYLAWYVLRDGVMQPEEGEVLGVSIAFFLFSVGLTLRILAVPRASVARRVLGMIADNAVISYCLIRMGESGAVVLFVYLFVTFGNGFRYGRRYLRACQFMALGSFVVVLLLSPFWSQHLWIGVGFLIALAVLPYYVGALAERINAERVKAEEALKECLDERERRGS